MHWILKLMFCRGPGRPPTPDGRVSLSPLLTRGILSVRDPTTDGGFAPVGGPIPDGKDFPGSIGGRGRPGRQGSGGGRVPDRKVSFKILCNPHVATAASIAVVGTPD